MSGNDNESLIKTDWAFKKEVERYNDSIDNYQIPNELMVTITLNEYRRLLTEDAKVRTKAAIKYDRESKIRELEQKLKEAESKIELLLCEKCGKKAEVESE